jgi:hypothetical protein
MGNKNAMDTDTRLLRKLSIRLKEEFSPFSTSPLFLNKFHIIKKLINKGHTPTAYISPSPLADINNKPKTRTRNGQIKIKANMSMLYNFIVSENKGQITYTQGGKEFLPILAFPPPPNFVPVEN